MDSYVEIPCVTAFKSAQEESVQIQMKKIVGRPLHTLRIMLLSRLLHQFMFNRKPPETIPTAEGGDTMLTTTVPRREDAAVPQRGDAAAASVASNNVVHIGAGGSSNHYNISNHTSQTTINNSAHTHHHYGNRAGGSDIHPAQLLLPPGKNNGNNNPKNVEGPPGVNGNDAVPTSGGTNPTLQSDKEKDSEEEEVKPLQNVYNADGKAIIIPHELIPVKASDITTKHCTLYFELYAHFSQHDKCNDESVREIVRDKGGAGMAIKAIALTDARVQNFQVILKSLHSEITEKGRMLFKKEVTDRFGKEGIKAKGSGQAPASFEDCMSILTNGKIVKQLTTMKYSSLYPAVLAYKCVHAIKAVKGDPFKTALFDDLLEFGSDHNCPFTFSQQVKTPEGSREKCVTHNVINVAKLGWADLKKACNTATQLGLGIKVKNNICKPTEGQLLIPIRTIAPEVVVKEEGEEKGGGKKKKKSQGPYFLITKSRMFGPTDAASITDKEATDMLSIDGASRPIVESATMFKAQGLTKSDALSRFCKAWDELNGVVGAAPLTEDSRHYHQDHPSSKAPPLSAQGPSSKAPQDQPGNHGQQAFADHVVDQQNYQDPFEAMCEEVVLGDQNLFDNLSQSSLSPMKADTQHGQQTLQSTGHGNNNQGRRGNGRHGSNTKKLPRGTGPTKASHPKGSLSPLPYYTRKYPTQHQHQVHQGQSWPSAGGQLGTSTSGQQFAMANGFQATNLHSGQSCASAGGQLGTSTSGQQFAMANGFQEASQGGHQLEPSSQLNGLGQGGGVAPTSPAGGAGGTSAGQLGTSTLTGVGGASVGQLGTSTSSQQFAPLMANGTLTGVGGASVGQLGTSTSSQQFAMANGFQEANQGGHQPDPSSQLNGLGQGGGVASTSPAGGASVIPNNTNDVISQIMGTPPNPTSREQVSVCSFVSQ